MRYRTKVTLFLLAVAGFSGGLLLCLSHFTARALAFELIQEKVLSVALTIAPQIDGDAHDRIRTRKEDQNEDYLKVRKILRDAWEANQGGDYPIRFIYTYRPTDEEGKRWEYVVDAEEFESEKRSVIGEPVELDDYEGIFPKVDKADVDTVFITDSYGTFLSAWAPVIDSEGKSVALVGVDVEAAEVTAKRWSLLFAGLAALIVSLVAAAAASFFLSGMVTAPLRTLKSQVGLIHDGDLTTRIPVESKDEFGELGESINKMADGLKEREAFKEALVRFVSSGTTDSVIESGSKEGDSTARRVTVLVAGLRNFDAVSTALPADKVFAFLSDWYSTMIDAILRHRGSIENSTGELVTATFGAPLNDPDQERHAVEAALTMQQNLVGLSKRWNISDSAALSLNAAIHTGQVTVSDHDDLQVMEDASLERIIGAVSLIRDAANSADAGGIVISEATEDGLKGTIPLTYVRSIEIGRTGEMLSLHLVQMPAPASD